jgi:uncharacterized membrane protein YgcG
MDYTAKVCNNCEHAIRKPVWLFFNRWYCRHPVVRAVFNPVHGNSVECSWARDSSRSPCGPTANCYDGPADFKPDPNRPMTYLSSMSATCRLPVAAMYHTNGIMSADERVYRTAVPSSFAFNNSGGGGIGGGGLVAGLALGYMLGHNNDSPVLAAEPWSGGGGEMNGGGASDSWDSGSDGGSSDSGGDSGGGDSGGGGGGSDS